MNLENQPLRTHEQILVFAKNGKFVFNPQREARTPLSLKRYPAGIEGIVYRTKHKIKHYNIASIPFNVPSDGMGHPKSIQDFGAPQEKGAPWEKLMIRDFLIQHENLLECLNT